MQNSFTAYAVKVTVLTIILSILGLGIFNYALHQQAFQSFFFIIVLFYSASLVAFYVVERLTNAQPKRFIQYYTLFSGMKLIFYSLSLVIMLFIWRPDALKIAFCFASCYFCYTALELVSVMKSLK